MLKDIKDLAWAKSQYGEYWYVPKLTTTPWDVEIGIDWISIVYYTHYNNDIRAEILFPAPADKEQAKKLAIELAYWLEDKLVQEKLL